jgi:hypothetical protein
MQALRDTNELGGLKELFKNRYNRTTTLTNSLVTKTSTK